MTRSIPDSALRIVRPCREFRGAYLDMMDESIRAGETQREKDYKLAREDFESFLRKCSDFEAGRSLPKGMVPESVYWLVLGGQVVGQGSLRHELNGHLLHEGGHIGYHVRPTMRNRGYATRLCGLLLEEAAQRGITRVLITCDRDNLASARVIRKNGGVLEDERVSRMTGKTKQRYWVNIEP